MIEEYRNEKSNDITISFKAGAIDEIRERELEKNSSRVFNDGKIYSANYYGQIENSKLKDLALENPFSAIEYDYELESSNNLSKETGTKLNSSEVYNFSSEVLEFFKRELPEFRLTGKITHENHSKSLSSTNDVSLSAKTNSTTGFIAFKRIGSPNIDDTFIGVCAPDGKFKEEDYKLFVDIHKKYDDLIELEAGKYPVVFTSTYIGHLRTLGESISPENYHSGSAYYTGKLGQKIFNEKINLVDVRTDEKYSFFNPFNDEGETTQDELPIIKNGVLENILYDKKVAKKYNAKSTGSGFREYNKSITPQMKSLDFLPTGETLKDIFEAHEKVIFISIAGGGDTTSNGDFSSPIQLGFLIENGQVKGKLPDVTISNNVDKMMGDDFIAVAKDIYEPGRNHPFICHMDVLV